MASAAGRYLRLRFSTLDPRGGGRRQADQRVALAATRPGFGGERWWFVDDGRRVGQLHLPPEADQFRSRRAHELAYASQSNSGRSARLQRQASRRPADAVVRPATAV